MIAKPAPGARYQWLDLMRGLAILAMIVFHIAWDLYYFGYSSVDVTVAPGWVLFQKAILSSFLLLVGAGLMLAHRGAIRWRAFWRRFALLVAAALLVTAGTYWMFPDYFVFFGVLHAIAVFSLAALPLLRLPPPAILAVGLGVLAVSFAISDPVFSSRELGWIGFWPVSPPTSDVVPVFPWFGVVLIGAALTGLVRGTPLWVRLAGFRTGQPVARGIAVIGRWSLPVYLVHQPLIIAALYGLMQLQAPALAPPVPSTADAFLLSCGASCRATDGDAGRCERYCACALEQVEQNGLWAVIDAPARTAEEQRQVDALARLCTAMAR
ncbi:heparan-alpha-glucosaminide N-acetyltransferase [Devosia sp.]|uniref:heparan-alpha-glucosaminide N-acetyltransferase n=1 Tax=Devosia sp. TaxID=1871048 RepID=UPI0035B3801C